MSGPQPLSGGTGAIDAGRTSQAQAVAQGVALLRAAQTAAQVGAALESLKRSLDPQTVGSAGDYSRASPSEAKALRDQVVAALAAGDSAALATVDGALTQLATLSAPTFWSAAVDQLERLVARPPLDKAAEKSAAELAAYAQTRTVDHVSDDAPSVDRLRRAGNAALKLKQETFAPKERVLPQKVYSFSGGERPATKPDDAVSVRNEWVKDFNEREARKAAGNMGFRLRLLHAAPEGSAKAKTYSELIDALVKNPDLLATALLDPRFESPESWRWVDSKIAPILKEDGWSVERPEDFAGALRFTGSTLLDTAFDASPKVREAAKRLWPALRHQALVAHETKSGKHVQDDYLTKLRIARWEVELGVLNPSDRAAFHQQLGLDNEGEQRRLTIRVKRGTTPRSTE